jgi:predicted dehydrogenase
MKTIRAGIIGLGVGEQHLKSYAAQPGVEVHAICDIDTEHLRKVGDRHDISKRHTDFKALTEDPDIDVISVCSFDDCHAEQVISAFENGKHVMVEKPVALHRSEAKRILRSQQDSGKFITSNLILRESPRFQQVRDMIRSGKFGEVFCLEGDYIHQILWKLTEGWRGKMDFYCTIYGGGIHLIDLMRWLIEDEIEEVAAMGNKVLTRDTAYKFDDTFFTLLRFSRGAMGKGLTTLGPQRTKFHALNVYGTKLTFINDMPTAKLFDGDEPVNESPIETAYPGMKKGDLIPEFIDAIRTGHEPNVSARDVFRIMDVCFAAREAAENRKTVTVSYQI